jgi:hypothetical protein
MWSWFCKAAGSIAAGLAIVCAVGLVMLCTPVAAAVGIVGGTVWAVCAGITAVCGAGATLSGVAYFADKEGERRATEAAAAAAERMDAARVALGQETEDAVEQGEVAAAVDPVVVLQARLAAAEAERVVLEGRMGTLESSQERDSLAMTRRLADLEARLASSGTPSNAGLFSSGATNVPAGSAANNPSQSSTPSQRRRGAGGE